jgi:hypothetical protein
VSIENAWRALDQVSALIRFADAKAVAALTVSGVLGGWVLTTFPPRHLLKDEIGRTLLEAGSLTALAVAAVFALLAMRPRTRSTYGAPMFHFEEAARRFVAEPDRFAQSCQYGMKLVFQYVRTTSKCSFMAFWRAQSGWAAMPAVLA